MGLEIRGNKKYFYRSRRVDGRVAREYVGSGSRAEEEARLESEERARRKRLKEIERKLDLLDEVCNELVEAWMYACGYHKPNRGPWRKRREPAPPAPAAP
jgi:hypothetical protein